MPDEGSGDGESGISAKPAAVIINLQTILARTQVRIYGRYDPYGIVLAVDGAALTTRGEGDVTGGLPPTSRLQREGESPPFLFFAIFDPITWRPVLRAGTACAT